MIVGRDISIGTPCLQFPPEPVSDLLRPGSHASLPILLPIFLPILLHINWSLWSLDGDTYFYLCFDFFHFPHMPLWSDCLLIFGQMRPIQPALCSLLRYQCSHPWSVDDERCVQNSEARAHFKARSLFSRTLPPDTSLPWKGFVYNVLGAAQSHLKRVGK